MEILLMVEASRKHPGLPNFFHQQYNMSNCSIERCDESNHFFDAFHSTFVLAEVGGSIVFQGLANRAARNIPQTIKQLIMKVYRYAGIFFPAICWLKKLSGYDATLIWARIITPSNWVNQLLTCPQKTTKMELLEPKPMKLCSWRSHVDIS